MPVRIEEEVLARARAIHLSACLAEGTPVVLLREELHRHGLGIHLTKREVAWFWEHDAIDETAESLSTSASALAWVLGLVTTIDGSDRDALADVLDERSPTATMRTDDDVRAMLDRDTRVDVRRALVWTLGDEAW
jgi:hypothetical protein